MEDFHLVATAWAAAILGALYLYLTWGVIAVRRGDGISIGDNDDAAFAKKIRGHANAAEQIPLGLILIGLNEAMNSTPTALTLAALLVVGRVMHAVHYSVPGTTIKLRAYGMLFTLVSYALGVIGLVLGLIL